MPILTPEQLAAAKAKVLADAPSLEVLRHRNPPPGQNLSYWPIPFATRTSRLRWLAAHVILALALAVFSGCALTTAIKLRTPIGTVTRETHTTVSPEAHDYAPEPQTFP